MANDNITNVDQTKFSTPENTRPTTTSINTTGSQSVVSSLQTLSPSVVASVVPTPPNTTTNVDIPGAKRTIVRMETVLSVNEEEENLDEELESNSINSSTLDGITSLGHSMPRYCVTSTKRSSSLTSFTVDMKNVLAEIEESGDGGDSDVEGQLAEILDEAVQESVAEQRQFADDTETVEFLDRNLVMFEPNSESLKSKNPYVPTPPEDWIPDVPKIELGEPPFESVDNPGDWSPYTFRPEFEGGGRNKRNGGQYKGHFLPTGATPVPIQSDGKRSISGWEFHYKGWDRTESDVKHGRSDSSTNELFPDSRKGCLDSEVLQSLGLNRERMVFGDALFFYQLLLPICNPKKSGIPNDPRHAFYSNVTNYSNLYACSIGLIGAQYSHAFKSIKVDELVHFDGVLVRDGALGGSNGALYRRWLIGESMYDPSIHDSITYDRFLQLKRTYKLCNNYIDGNKLQSDPSYNPAYKYDLIFKAMVNNCNAITKYADLDLCGDETTFSHMGYGEPNTGLLKRLGQTKPGITRGMQTVMLFDAHRNYPRAYLHRHKLHPNPLKLPSGPNECRLLLEQIDKMVVGANSNQKKIFREKPHSTWDNYFSGDAIFDWIGKNGFSCTMTCRRDRFPKEIPKQYLQVKKTDTSRRTKVARFQDPIVAVKVSKCSPDSDKTFERAHISFQSTSSCNIATVNALNGCKFSVRAKQRGKNKDNKRHWVIEMNDARSLYLSTYGSIDNVDKLVKFCRMKCCSWKYWHAAMLHAKAMVCAIAYGIYIECSEGNLNPAWKVDKTLSFWEFRDKLGRQLLSYDPRYGHYPGDKLMRSYTAMNKDQRHQKKAQSSKRNKSSSVDNRSAASSKRKDRTEGEDDDDSSGDESDNSSLVEITTSDRVTISQFNQLKKKKHSRLCGDLGCFTVHVNHLKKIKCAKQCEVCGVDVYTVCSLCPGRPGLHFFPSKGIAKGKQCFVDYHNDDFFGLAKGDMTLFKGKRLKDWKPPSKRAAATNAKHIREIKKENDK